MVRLYMKYFTLTIEDFLLLQSLFCSLQGKKRKKLRKKRDCPLLCIASHYRDKAVSGGVYCITDA